jgi:hypothetical protein
MSSRILISLEGRLKSHPSFASLLQNNLFRETVFSLLQLFRKQENRDYRMESPFQQIVIDPVNQAFHDLCRVLTPPPGTKQLLRIGLKYCLKETPSSKVIQEGNTHLTRDIRCHQLFHFQPPPEEPAILDPKLYIKSKWEPRCVSEET